MSKIEIICNEWKLFKNTPFPSSNGGEEVKGVCLVSVDTFASGCIDTFVKNHGNLDGERINILIECVSDTNKIVDDLQGEAKSYFITLLKLSELVLEVVNH